MADSYEHITCNVKKKEKEVNKHATYVKHLKYINNRHFDFMFQSITDDAHYVSCIENISLGAHFIGFGKNNWCTIVISANN